MQVLMEIILLILILFYKNISHLMLGILIYSVLNIYCKNNKKTFIKIMLLIIVITLCSLCVGVQYKLLFNLLLFGCIAFKFKKSWLSILLISFILSPNVNINKLSFENSIGKSYHFDYYDEKNASYDQWQNINGESNGDKLRNNISYYYNKCQLYTVFCNSIENIKEGTGSTSSNYLQTSISQKAYFDNYGNVYKIVKNTGIDSKRYKYDYNQAISKKDITLKTIFIPFSKEDFIIYNYYFFRSYALENLSEKKCKLLFYGTKNGWVEYKNRLLEELKNDKNNLCISDLENYNFEIKKNKLDNDKQDIINILAE